MSDSEYVDYAALTPGDISDHILYKSDKGEKEAIEFYARVRSQAKDPEGEIFEDEGNEHRRWVFEKECDWKGYRFPRFPRKEDFGVQIFSFEYVIFKERVKLDDAHFEGSPLFWHAQFREGVSFNGTHFKGPAVSFRQAEFQHPTSFYKTQFETYSNFNGASFGGRAAFPEVQFSHPPNFRDTHFEDSTWEAYAYRKAKNQWEQEGDRENADYYFRQEMIMKRRQLPFYSAKKLFSYIIDWITGYGTNWGRIFTWWILVIFGYGLSYASFNGLQGTLEGVEISQSLTWSFPPPFISGDVVGVLKNIYFSIVTFTTLGYGDIAPEGLTWQLVAGSESVIGGILMATLVLVLGRKFMR